MSDWEIDERMPRYNDRHEFDVWMRHGGVRRVHRVGNRSTHFSPGTLLFTDCTDPLQNAICDEDYVVGWRLSGRLAPPPGIAFPSLIGGREWPSLQAGLPWRERAGFDPADDDYA